MTGRLLASLAAVIVLVAACGSGSGAHARSARRCGDSSRRRSIVSLVPDAFAAIT